MKIKKLVFASLGMWLTAACSDSHLEIFPPLEDPGLMTQKLDPEAMKEDVDAYYYGALERHPDLAGYADQKALHTTINSIKASLTVPLTRAEFYRHIGQLTHTFGDGHSMLIWPYPEYAKLQEGGTKPFSFRVHIDRGDQIFIKTGYHDGNGTTVEAGSKIIAINDIPAYKLIDSMQRYVGGETEYLRKQFVAGRFPIYLWAVHGIAGDMTLSLETPTGIKTVAISNSQNWQSENVDTESGQDLYFKDMGDGVAYLHVGTFDVEPDQFEDFINDSFNTFRDISATSLIVDVRSNTGGNTDTALYLARHLANKRFRMASRLREKLNQDNRGIFDYKGDVGDIIDSDWDEWEEPIDHGVPFRDNIYVLVSPITYSAGIVFTSTMKDFGFATLVGQETGGNANQTAQGNLFNLPHSQLRAYITTRMLVRPSGSLAPGGVKPDFSVYPTQQSLKAGRDVELEKALELIQNKL